MKRLRLVLLLLGLATALARAEQANLSALPAPHSALATDVFVSGQEGYKGFRIPDIEVAPDGALLAFAEARKSNLGDPGAKGNTIDLVMKRSTDGGAHWSALCVIEAPGELWSAANPATVVDRASGRILLFYVRCRPGASSSAAHPGSDDVRNLLRTSADGGLSWSEPQDLTEVSRDLKAPDWRSSFAGPGCAIQTRSGRLIVPMWKVDKPWGVFAIFSDDGGRTWSRGEAVPGGLGDENQVVELADGKIMMDFRQRSGPNRWLALSSDGGRTWSAPRPGLAVTPCCCALARHALKSAGEGSGRLVWTGPLGPGRTKLVLRTSDDDGKTFPAEHLLSAEAAAYSDLAVLNDKSLGVLWERAGYKFITFTRVPRTVVEGK